LAEKKFTKNGEDCFYGGFSQNGIGEGPEKSGNYGFAGYGGAVSGLFSHDAPVLKHDTTSHAPCHQFEAAAVFAPGPLTDTGAAGLDFIMLGPLVNAAVIVVCALAGSFLIRGIPDRFEEIVKKAIGLSIVYVGIKGALESQRMLLLIMSMVGGSVIGELVNIDRLMNRFGLWAEKKLGVQGASGGGASKKSFSRGFVSASIIFCTGAMAIVGSLQSGLEGNHKTLFAKSILDGSISLVFGASLGLGVAFSALPVLVYQGGIVLASLAIRDYLTPDIIREMSAVGSLLIAALGFNFLNPGDRGEIRVANLIPAMFIPWAYLALAAR
jgi:uncharacterized membrane protein YqgA involved in biofilm formation